MHGMTTSRTSVRTTFLLAALVSAAAAHAQIPDKCIEIESILVDACNPATICPGSSEGQNEMVRFRTGPAALALGDIVANWPNGLWRGFIQNATTASITAQLNATIEACGWLIEPPGGIIPPGSVVILVTSTDMCVAANSFEALVDTVFLTFQAPGNTQGHFANHNNGATITTDPTGAPDFRTLIMRHTPTNCSDTVTYDRSQLVNIYGTYGGFGPDNDGSTAVFSWPGEPPVVSYVNFGCQAPFAPLSVDAQASGTLCVGVALELTGAVTGSYTDLQWTGGTGTFSDPGALTTTYTSGPGDAGQVVLQLCVQGACADPVCATLTLDLLDIPEMSITADGPTALCPGESVLLTATGADDIIWEPQGDGPTLLVDMPGTYIALGNNACGEGSASITITLGDSPNIIITPDGPTALCPGETVTLTASGATDFVWEPGGPGPSIVVDTPGTYTVNGTSSCGEGSASITITEGDIPVLVITADGPTALCPGESVTLTASGAQDYLWDPGGAGASIVVVLPGTYTVTGTNACGEDSASITITTADAPTVIITGDTAPCVGSTTTLTASGADSYVWSTGEDSPSITVAAGGTYTVTGTSSCGTGVASVTVTFVVQPEVSITGSPYLCPVAMLAATGNDPVLWSTGATTLTIAVSEPGIYSVTATNACGSSSASVEVLDNPITASFMPSAIEGEAPLLVTFTNFSLPQGSDFDWNFGDGNTSDATAPVNLYTIPGVYTVTLTATLGECSATSSLTITVYGPDTGESAIEVPNVFSPNGDGVNDVFQVMATNIARMELSVYNRWGQRVALLEYVMQVWDGRTFAGEVVPPGTYFYALQATGDDGRAYDLTGSITVVR